MDTASRPTQLTAARYRECLDADFRRMREVAARDLNARVPSCPDWDVAELVQHTGMVFLHKVFGMQTGGEPEEWPPPGTKDEEPLALFDRAYAALNAEFDKRDPSEKTGTWYTPDQTVGFWIRRMAQETVIHRADAELALNEHLATIPDDLAIDGVDEVIIVFLSFITTTWAAEIPALNDCDGRAVRVETDGASWTLHLTPTGVTVDDANDHDAVVSGSPSDVLLWLWRRADDDTVVRQGDEALLTKLRDLLGGSTQ